MIGLFIAAFLAVIFGGAMAAVEASLARVRRHQVETYVEEGRRGADALTDLMEDASPAFMVLSFLRVIAEMGAAVLITVAVSEWLDSLWQTIAVSVGIMALASFVLVGVSPRTWGRQHAASLALLSAPLVRWLRDLLAPVAHILVAIGNAVTPGRGYRDGPFDSEAELREFVDMASDSAMIEAEERRMIHSVFELGDTIAREVIVPRTDMVTIDCSKSLRQAFSLFYRSGFSRVPVVDGSPDNVEGVLYFKDVAGRMLGREDRREDPVSEVMRDAWFVPDSKPADDLLREMQTNRTHFAIVIDEYGGTSGLVTLEDILEEVVGEIDDEFDRATPTAQPLEDGTTRVPARMAVDDFAELFDVTLEDEDVDTIGGLLTKLVGRVPLVGASAEIAGLRLTAERMAGRRHQIATILVDSWPPERMREDDTNPGADRPGGEPAKEHT